eukprot:2518769-Amphidinium_carterae.1
MHDRQQSIVLQNCGLFSIASQHTMSMTVAFPLSDLGHLQNAWAFLCMHSPKIAGKGELAT